MIRSEHGVETISEPLHYLTGQKHPQFHGDNEQQGDALVVTTTRMQERAERYSFAETAPDVFPVISCAESGLFRIRLAI